MKLRSSAIKLKQWSSYFRTAGTLASIRNDLLSRPPNVIYDYISPTPSHLLNISLADFLPPSCYPQSFSATEALPSIETDSSASVPRPLPQGHHIVYFPPPTANHALLPDSTDRLHSPTEPTPYVRRLWAGGDLAFNSSTKSAFYLDGSRAACIENIKDVTIKGQQGEEKIFVHIERQIGCLRHRSESQNLDADQIMLDSDIAVVERRVLVFMRERSAQEVKLDLTRIQKSIKPSCSSDFSVILTPPSSLLFRFSALTFNAHKIHVDPQYCREVEGHRSLLVHGPLTLVLMLSVLRSQLRLGELISTFSYRNLTPLYADEQMKICLKKDTRQNGRFEVWIENKEGGYAVKGSATIGVTKVS